MLPNVEVKMNLKGILVGNACTNPRECYEPSYKGEDTKSIYQYEYLYAHGYLTDHEYEMITGSCTMGFYSDGCKEWRNISDTKFEKTMTVINNIYQPCYHQTIPYAPQPLTLQGRNSPNTFTTCEDLIGIMHFLNSPSMHVWLHVDSALYKICNDDVANKYQMHPDASEWIYPILIKAGLRVWVYSGDNDANVPITGTLRWIELMKDVQGYPIIEPWREWWVPGLHKHEDQMGGMVWKLRGLTFVSVKGAGHMVPADKPK